MQATAETATWYVVCLCAQWCSTCRAYAPDFLAQSGLEQVGPAERYLWVDVEAHDDLLGDWDIETFPTLLIAQGDQPVLWVCCHRRSPCLRGWCSPTKTRVPPLSG